MKAFVILSTVAVCAFAQAATAYTLPYQKSNRWVAEEDAKDLRQLVQDAKAKGAYHFTVRLPNPAEQELYVSRLEVLRKVLERNLNRGIVIEQVLPPLEQGNTIEVELVK